MDNLTNILVNTNVDKNIIKSKDLNDNTEDSNVINGNSKQKSPDLSNRVLLMFNSKERNEIVSPRTFKKQIDKIDIY
jgi:hypothetical protein